MPIRDHIGKLQQGGIYSHLTIIGSFFRALSDRWTGKPNDKRKWVWYCVCECSCGKICVRIESEFYKKTGEMSCGHLRGKTLHRKPQPKRVKPFNESTGVVVQDSYGGFTVGQRVSSLLVIGPFFRVRQKQPSGWATIWYCVTRCHCGEIYLTHIMNWEDRLRGGGTISCGCGKADHMRSLVKHRSLTAWGETKDLDQWMIDPRCGVGSKGALRYRLSQGMDAEEAISRFPWELRDGKETRRACIHE